MVDWERIAKPSCKRQRTIGFFLCISVRSGFSVVNAFCSGSISKFDKPHQLTSH